jgi:hypothetical protein
MHPDGYRKYVAEGEQAFRNELRKQSGKQADTTPVPTASVNIRLSNIHRLEPFDRDSLTK